MRGFWVLSPNIPHEESVTMKALLVPVIVILALVSGAGCPRITRGR